MPSELGAKLQNLQKLYLINNMLSELGMLQNLEILYCHINALGGGGRSDLFYVNLLDNDITGSIPDSVGDLSRLRLYFYKNRILGSIPDDMGKMSSLCVLDLGKKIDCLQGSIPVLLGLLSRLDFSINLPNSHFEGQLPASIGKLVSLQAIDFSKNKNLGEHLYPGGLEEGACKLTLNEKISIATGRILDVVDTTLKLEAYSRGTPGALAELKLCSIQRLDIGMMCTEESPHNDPRCPRLCQC
ncbi:hypothetical protein ACFX13_010555 [Malus domestica]